MNKTYFASNLRYLRTKRNLEQLELAQLLGRKSASSISEWEKGSYTPKAGILSDIARIFDVDLTELMHKDLTGSEVRITPITDNSPIPLLGTIAAGAPILAEEHIEEYFNIDSKIKADFALRIKGDSMINAGINEGDIVFIREQCTLENSQIGAILIDSEATLKKFYQDNGTVILQSENKAYPPMIFKEGHMRILGKLVAVLSMRE